MNRKEGIEEMKNEKMKLKKIMITLNIDNNSKQ